MHEGIANGQSYRPPQRPFPRENTRRTRARTLPLSLGITPERRFDAPTTVREICARSYTHPMPELPEVEHLRRTLEPLVVGRMVSRVRLERRDVVVRASDPPGGFSRSGLAPTTQRVPARELLSGQRVLEIVRHGKQMAIVSDSGRALCVHLGMSGQVLHLPPGARAKQADHVHVVWTLDDGSHVLFRDPRRFGGIWVFASFDALRSTRWSALGPDALTVGGRALHARLGHTARPVKAALLDQSVIAGVGNIYADEALFLSRIHPATRSEDLDATDAARLARAIRGVLRQSIGAGGSTLRDYADAAGAPGKFQLNHRVYGRAGEACTACGISLESAVLAQRTTVWCPLCQPVASPRSIPTIREVGSAVGSLSLCEKRV